MAHLNKFGLKNFRVFELEYIFDFAPITILTGANNSGKSSLLKALQLLKENNKTINSFADLTVEFADADHKLGGLKNVLNNQNQPLVFGFSSYFPGTVEHFYTRLEYIADDSINIENGIIKRITITKGEHSKELILDIGKDESLADVYFLDINYILDTWLPEIRKYIQKYNVLDKIEKRLPLYIKHWELKDYEFIDLAQEMLNSNFKENCKLYHYKYSIEKSVEYLSKIFSENMDAINSNNKVPFDFSGLLKKCIDNNKLTISDLRKLLEVSDTENRPDKFVDDIRKFMSINKKKWTYMIKEHHLSLIERWGRSEKIKDWGDIEEILLEDLMSHSFGGSTDIVTHPIIGQSIKLNPDGTVDAKDLVNFKTKPEDELFKTIPNGNYISFNYLAANLFFRLLTSAFHPIEKLEFLNVSRPTYQRSYKIGRHGSDFERQLFDYLSFPVPETGQLFLNDWIKRFELDDLTISYDRNNIASVSIGNRTLADMGFGVSQILSILLKIVSIYAKEDDRISYSENEKLKKLFPNRFDFLYSHVLILEEPEANLHPKFQSLLADLLIDANKKFNIQFIIETHSEYLIRKLQYLTAKKVIMAGEVIAYYFNHPNKVPKNEKQVKKITIEENGTLSQGFGPGFFDEADNLAMQLFVMNANSNN